MDKDNQRSGDYPRNYHYAWSSSAPPTTDSTPDNPHSSAHSGNLVPRSSSSSRRHGKHTHQTYRGIRARGSKWVSEIREPRKSARFWLGTYPTPEMAAAAYDAAALALKGSDAILNFPECAGMYPVPVSLSVADIRVAVEAAAATRGPQPDVNNVDYQMGEDQYMDEDAMFDMPNYLAEMAEGMMVSPPTIKPSDDDPGEGSSSGKLWGYP